MPPLYPVFCMPEAMPFMVMIMVSSVAFTNGWSPEMERDIRFSASPSGSGLGELKRGWGRGAC